MSKANVKLLLMVFIGFFTYGLVGVGAILLMTLLSYIAVGRDAAASHGISQTDSSRLGGLAIAGIVTIYLVGMLLLTPYVPGAMRSNQDFFLWLAVLACALLGLAEDLKADFLTPTLRLACKFLVFGSLFWFWPEFIPHSLGIPLVDQLLAPPILAWIIITVFAVGFINAFNMADGANGLVPGICVAAFTIFFLEYGRPTEGLFLFACLMFLVFNLISGWFFLGDMGSYGIGAIIVCYGLNGVANGDFSALFMASLVAYPCLDFLVSIVRRLRLGRSPFSADNDHLHNRLHKLIKGSVRSKVLANSLTGLTISGSTAGLTLWAYVFEWWALASNSWFLLFTLECCLYWLAYSLTEKTKGITQYAEPL